MAVSKAREQEYVRALMALGPAPAVDRIKQFMHYPDYEGDIEKLRNDVEQFQASSRYNAAVQKYFLIHALGTHSDNNWIEGFYEWQRATITEVIHDEVIVCDYTNQRRRRC